MCYLHCSDLPHCLTACLMKNMLLFLISLCTGLAACAQANDTLQLYFPMNEAGITRPAAAYLDSLIFNDVLMHGQQLIVLGYADYVGDNAANIALSGKRAQHVQDYLIQNGFKKTDITLCAGRGRIDRAPVNGRKGFAADRKVLIIINNAAGVAPAAQGVNNMAAAGINQTVALNNILFRPSSDVLLPQSLPVLDTLYNFLAAHSTMKVRIEGHICCYGPPTGADEPFGSTTLSKARAARVYDYLITRGIPAGRLSFTGLGNAGALVYPEETDEDMMHNRRVDVRVLSK